MNPLTQSTRNEPHVDYERMAYLDAIVRAEFKREALESPNKTVRYNTAIPTNCARCKELVSSKEKARLHCAPSTPTPAHLAERATIRRLFLDGKNTVEISRITGIAYRTVWSRLRTQCAVSCLVRFREGARVREVQVIAGSVMEAAAIGYRELKDDSLAAAMDDDAVHIEVAVRRPSVLHRISLDSLKSWAKRYSPQDIIERDPIRKILEGS